MSTHQSSTDVTANDELYTYIYLYEYSSDLEFRHGLGMILGHPGRPASEAELVAEKNTTIVIQAKCFYISRKKNIEPPLDVTAYRNWLIDKGLLTVSAKSNTKTNTSTNTNTNSTSTSTSTSTSNSTANQTSAQTNNNNKNTHTQTLEEKSTPSLENNKDADAAEPAYPSSFAHIVDLITNNQPIPGIEEIPDTVLTGQDEPSKVDRRRKPWEKEVEVDVVGSNE